MHGDSREDIRIHGTCTLHPGDTLNYDLLHAEQSQTLTLGGAANGLTGAHLCAIRGATQSGHRPTRDDMRADFANEFVGLDREGG